MKEKKEHRDHVSDYKSNIDNSSHTLERTRTGCDVQKIKEIKVRRCTPIRPGSIASVKYFVLKIFSRFLTWMYSREGEREKILIKEKMEKQGWGSRRKRGKRMKGNQRREGIGFFLRKGDGRRRRRVSKHFLARVFSRLWRNTEFLFLFLSS